MFTTRKTLSLLILILTSVAFLSALGLVVTWAAPGGEPQGEQRMRMMRLEIYRDQPVEITAIKVGGMPIESKRKFKAGSDWLDGMTITLKNVYDKPVAYITVMIGVYYERSDGTRIKRGGKDVQAATELQYGFQPPRPGEPDPPYYVAPLLPGHSVDVAMTERVRNQIDAMMREGKASTDVTEISVRVYSVFLEGDSDTKWRGWWFRRDPNDPNSFRRISSRAPSSRVAGKRRFLQASHAGRRRALLPPEDTVIDPCELKDERDRPGFLDAFESQSLPVKSD